jgi:hypothetical protein
VIEYLNKKTVSFKASGKKKVSLLRAAESGLKNSALGQVLLEGERTEVVWREKGQEQFLEPVMQKGANLFGDGNRHHTRNEGRSSGKVVRLLTVDFS